jgi:hypothetical protein
MRHVGGQVTRVRLAPAPERRPDLPGVAGERAPASGLTLRVELSQGQLDAIARRVAELLAPPQGPALELLTVPRGGGAPSLQAAADP